MRPDYTINPLELDRALALPSALPRSRVVDGYNTPAVYAWRDADTGEVVYVGKALRVRNRLMRHWYASQWLIDWLSTGAVPIVDVWIVAAQDRAGIERSMIDAHCPRYNRRRD